MPRAIERPRGLGYHQPLRVQCLCLGLRHRHPDLQPVMNIAAQESTLLGVIQSAMDAIITIDENHRIVLFNGAAETIFRCPAAEALGAHVERFIPARYRGAHEKHIERFGHTGATTRRMGRQSVIYGVRTDGEEFPIEASISQASVAGRKLYTVILRDITDRERAATELARSNQRLRELYESMHAVREAERTRIARELHDELAQWLTALKMDAAWVAARLPDEEADLRAKVERMKHVVDTTVAAVRRIAADLRPVMLDDLGLAPALESLLAGFSERTGIRTRLDARTGESELREPHATAVYRMVQEALTNVARHAQASAASVTLEEDKGKLRVTVTDDGVGISPQASSATKSYGLLGIRERAHTLGGAARIYRAPGKGTVVEISLPLEARGPEPQT